MKFEPHTLWMEQCEATRGIRERHGLAKALGYLIGEKLIGFVQESENEIRAYLETVENTGAEGHVLARKDLEFMREAGAFPEDPVRAAQEVLIVEQLKGLLA